MHPLPRTRLPNFVTKLGERGNTYITFSWAGCSLGRQAFPGVKPFVRELWANVPRLNDRVILQVNGKQLFEIVSPPIWRLNNVLLILAYKGPVDLLSQKEYEEIDG